MNLSRDWSAAAFAALMLLSAGCGSAEERGSTFLYPPYAHTWGVVRAKPFHLRLFLGSKVQFDDPQGLACARLDSWEDSTRTDDDDEVTVYGVNSGANCIIYNRSMFALDVYGLEAGDEKLNRPWGIAADASGRVYVVDRGNSRLLRLQNSGRRLRFERVIGSIGDGAGEFIDPRGVALVPDGRVFVADAALNRITVFDDAGLVVKSWGGLLSPDGIAAVGPGERDAFYPGAGFVVVIDSVNSRVSKFSLEGALLARASAVNWNLRLTPQLGWCAIDYHNQILITDRSNGSIHKLDRDLNYIASFGEPGREEYQFDQPRGIALYRRFGQVFVAEREGAQYLWVGADVDGFAAEVKEDSVRSDLVVRFRATEPTLVDLSLYDRTGRFVVKFLSGRRYPAGTSLVYWNLTIPAAQADGTPVVNLPGAFSPGKRIPVGEYQLRATFRATYSSRESFSFVKELRFKVVR